MHVPQHTNKLIFTFLYWQTPLSPASPPLPSLIVNNIFPLIHTHTSARIKCTRTHKPTTTNTYRFSCVVIPSRNATIVFAVVCRDDDDDDDDDVFSRLVLELLDGSSGTAFLRPNQLILLFCSVYAEDAVPLFRMTVCLCIFRPSPPPKIITERYILRPAAVLLLLLCFLLLPRVFVVRRTFEPILLTNSAPFSFGSEWRRDKGRVSPHAIDCWIFGSLEY